jgi:N-acetyl-beta-hexosaminidase
MCACTWMGAAVVGVKMSVWQTSASETLCALSSRVPAMADRSWNPQAGRTYADFQIRVSQTTPLLAKLIAGHQDPAPVRNNAPF